VKVSSLSCCNLLLSNLFSYLILLNRDSDLWESGGTEKIRRIREIRSPSLQGL
jgi:hypothetical protein